MLVACGTESERFDEFAAACEHVSFDELDDYRFCCASEHRTWPCRKENCPRIDEFEEEPCQ